MFRHQSVRRRLVAFSPGPFRAAGPGRRHVIPGRRRMPRSRGCTTVALASRSWKPLFVIAGNGVRVFKTAVTWSLSETSARPTRPRKPRPQDADSGIVHLRPSSPHRYGPCLDFYGRQRPESWRSRSAPAAVRAMSGASCRRQRDCTWRTDGPSGNSGPSSSNS